MSAGNWIVTIGGADHHLSGPAMLLFDNQPLVAEVAHSLAIINRFTGHTTRPYSVAEHSLLVCDIVRSMGLNCHAQRAALMHDAHEAFTGDASSPVKWELGTAWSALEEPQAMLVRRTFGMRTAHAAHKVAIKQADLIALATERKYLTAYTPGRNAPWPVLDTPGAEVLPLDVDLALPARAAQPWTYWRDLFVSRYNALTNECQGCVGAAA